MNTSKSFAGLALRAIQAVVVQAMRITTIQAYLYILALGGLISLAFSGP
jgi:hypothetical protein